MTDMGERAGVPGTNAPAKQGNRATGPSGPVSWLGMAMGIWLLGGVGIFALRFATSWVHQLP